ncbi:Aste57867_17896 [Aphanomyces stellatus]|uniref:Aste57867_17896 protein n=1 Tax=Aphanomyces stellatus TaxID=120398 RepID=A0A485L9K3_9STRA|nr:hypothetical protein As57867_017835 [Aphanomyces stellatus]VFT94638.1 Aste57867_17896 [Aphanomyces stellatus]
MNLQNVLLLAAAAILAPVDAVGRMLEPPARGYMGRLPQFKDIVPIDWSDVLNYAGGIGVTHSGKWGLCGDKYTDTIPREHENGGLYGLFPKLGNKVIAGCYAPGSTMNIQIQLTANHEGYFMFSLCKLNNRGDFESEECFKYMTQPNGADKWMVPDHDNKVYTIPYNLPAGVTCEGDSHCVLRWWYVAGNNPSKDPLDNQLIWNCADIYISNSCGGASPNSTSVAPVPSTAIPVPSTVAPMPSTNAPIPSTKAPVPSTWAPAPTMPSSVAPIPSSHAPSPSPATPSPSADASCGSCSNCFYAPTNACFVGWTADQCASVSMYKWCGN